MTTLPDQELAQIQAEVAVRRLTESMVRVAGLEKELGELRSQRDALFDALRTSASGLGEAAAQDLFPAVRHERIVRAFDIAQRRDIWLEQLRRFQAPESLYALYPHDGGAGSIRILVLGSGGFGDMLYLSSILRRLYASYGSPYIYILHPHPDAKAVFGGNPYVHDTIDGSAFDARLLIEPAAALDIFDLIVDVRYVVSYATPPLSRISPERLLSAHSRSAEWQRYVRYDWPYLNNALAREVVQRGMSQYDLLAYTGDLENEERQAGDFFELGDMPRSIHALAGKPFVTIHNGSDRFMAGRGGLQTKNLPVSTLNAVAAILSRRGFAMVQLGEPHEQRIDSIDVDLRGKTTFAETAAVLKYASAHVDSEGGLVHLALAVGTRSAVAFGPTSMKFFGYRGNRNLAPKLCGDCWWITRDWALTCARGLLEPECMDSHIPEELADAAASIAEEDAWGLNPIRSRTASQVGFVEQVIREANPAGRGALFIHSTPESNIEELLRHGGIKFDLFVDLPRFREIAAKFGGATRVQPFSEGAAPCDRAYDWAAFDGAGLTAPVAALQLFEASRSVKIGGNVIVGSAAGLVDLERELGMLPGAKGKLAGTTQEGPAAAVYTVVGSPRFTGAIKDAVSRLPSAIKRVLSPDPKAS